MKEEILERLGEQIPTEKLNDCLRQEAESGQTLDRILLRKGLLPETTILAIFAEALVLKANSHVEGEICYRELALEQGSYFEGKSRPHDNPLDMADAAPDATPRAQPIPQLRIA